jgi:enoyl-CoA hydratase
MIQYEKRDRIATIRLNRPEKYNTLRFEMLDQMDAALRDANRDDEIRVIVLEGAGDSFCGGFDFSGVAGRKWRSAQTSSSLPTTLASAPPTRESGVAT